MSKELERADVALAVLAEQTEGGASRADRRVAYEALLLATDAAQWASKGDAQASKRAADVGAAGVSLFDDAPTSAAALAVVEQARARRVDRGGRGGRTVTGFARFVKILCNLP